MGIPGRSILVCTVPAQVFRGFDCDPFSLEGRIGSLLRVFPTEVAADHLNSTCILNALARRSASSKRRKRKRSRTAMFFLVQFACLDVGACKGSQKHQFIEGQ
jgi:hypothetical protein